MVTESMNYLISYLSNNILVCMVIATSILGILILTNGSYILYSKLPLIWKGFYYINFSTYSY